MFKKQKPNYFVTLHGSKAAGYEVSLHIKTSILEQFNNTHRTIMGEKLTYCWGTPEGVRFSHFLFLPQYGRKSVFFENYADAEQAAAEINSEIADIINNLTDSFVDVQLLPPPYFS